MQPDTLLLSNVAELGVSEGAKVGDLTKGAQLGLGFNAEYLDSATPLVFMPTVLVVMQTPVMYNHKPQVSRMIKSVIESHAKTVTGIDFGYNLETGDGPVGHDGQTFAVPTKAKRSQVNPSFTFQEVPGNLIWNLFRNWLFDIQDPDTNASMQHQASDVASATPWVMSSYAMSMMAIQFDPTMLPENIIDAAFYTNMFPTDPGGTLGLERNIAQAKAVERTVTFTGIVQHNAYTRLLAKQIATQLRIAKVSFSNRLTAATEVAGTIANSGLQNEALAAIAKGQISNNANA